MKPIRFLAAALIAFGGLAVSVPTLAAPKDATAEALTGNLLLVGSRDRGEWRDGDRGEWHGRDGQRGKSRDGDRDRWRDGDRRWDDGRRVERRDYRGHDRGGDGDRHRGWDRGKHYGWGDRGHPRYYGKHNRWRTGHHPRHGYWVGRSLPRVEYVVIHEYNDYYLPPPRRGHYYVRHGSDVYLVAEATKRIIDAFVLLDAAGR